MRTQLTAVLAASALILTGCGSDDESSVSETSSPSSSAAVTDSGDEAASSAGNASESASTGGLGSGDDSSSDHSGSDHSGMDHSQMEHAMDGGAPPKGIEQVLEPTYPVGDQVKLTADHMMGMDGATATIVGAFSTYTYAVDFTPTTGGDPVKNHKWVVHQEVKPTGDERLTDGTEVTLLAEHMKGMEGATATIASSTDETVYMVDVEIDGQQVTNHKWVVESEIEPLS